MEIVLSQEETITGKQSFTTSLILFWLKANFTLTNKRLVGENPNTLIGLIPLGKNQITFPLKNIAQVSSSTKFYLFRFLLGIIVVFLGIKGFSSSFMAGFILSLLGIGALVNSYVATFVIASNSGQSTIVPLSILEKDKVNQLVTEINHKISEL